MRNSVAGTLFAVSAKEWNSLSVDEFSLFP
jgi:hypothetical protein